MPLTASATMASSATRIWIVLLFLVLVLQVSAFSTTTATCAGNSISARRQFALGMGALSEDVQQQLEKARALLQKSKEKLEATESSSEVVATGAAIKKGKDDSKTRIIPFFASIKEPPKRELVIKSINDEGLITTDGEKMASISEKETWEIRRLDDVFASEAKVSSMAGRSLSEKDTAANIFALRRQLQDSDFLKIFDKRNRFIGDID
jgi:hypothetical protein